MTLFYQSFLVLYTTKPSLTVFLALLSAAPPYYERIAITGTYSQASDSTQCHWQSKAQLTLQQISGQGL